ncbi:hypothetical protein TGPRC2_426080 [Toxoplasma gondii TgCatPRC2]|uniref:Uncharacterized protein n=1 Tax=Toxoplasma gondii TgCatPRC2 TaxID=1130821 RepID=A0A151H6Z5_TOXGO|nr:hypothetical protein TGPRC2_426080 [Toxoplasma gondii TgCatPRC2]
MARSTHQTPGVLSRRPAGSRISEDSQDDESGRSESSENASFSPPAHAPPGAASPSWRVIACAAAVVSLGTLNQIAGKIRSKPLGQFDYFVSLCNAVLYFTVYTLALVSEGRGVSVLSRASRLSRCDCVTAQSLGGRLFSGRSARTCLLTGGGDMELRTEVDRTQREKKLNHMSSRV